MLDFAQRASHTMWVAEEIEIRRVDKLQVNDFFCVLQSAGFAGQVLQVDPISVIANNYNIYERSRQEDFGSTQQKDQEETEDTVELFKRNGTDNHLYSY